MKLKVSIIIPTFNGWEDTKECLESISKLNYPKEKLELIIVDNASTDNTPKKIKNQKLKIKIKLIENRTNLGFAGAVNKGIEASSGDYIFIINNDIVFDKNFLTLLTDFMKKNPEVGITGGKIYYQKPKDKVLFSGASFNPWTGSITKFPYPNRIKESEWIQACALLIKREVINKIGPLDDGFFFTFEDLDFCQRAKRAGFKIIYYPKAVAWHKGGATIDRENLRKKALELYKAKFYHLFKNCSLPQIITSTVCQFFLIAPVRRLIIKNPPFFIRPMVSGYLYNLKRLPKIIKKRGLSQRRV